MACDNSGSDLSLKDSASTGEGKSESKSIFSDLIPVGGKITDRKLDVEGQQYIAWKRAIQYYFDEVGMSDHLTDEPSTDSMKARWVMEDRRLFRLMCNTLTSEVEDNTVHCSTVKELWESIGSLYSGKDNLHQIYDLTLSLFQPDGRGKSNSQIYTEFNRVFEQWNALLPITNDIDAMRSQREQLGALCYLMALPPELSAARQQILSSTEPLTRKSAYYRVQRAFRDSPSSSPSTNLNESTALVSSGTRGGRGNTRGGRGRGGRGRDSGEREVISCYYCKEPGHVKKYCPKLSVKNAQFSRFAHVMTSSPTPESENNRSIIMSENEFAEYMQFQASKQPSPTQPTATMVQTGNPIACLSNSKSRWVIDSGATDHMTGNTGILSSFQTSSSSHVTLANGSTASVVGSGIIDVTPDISLSNVLCLPKFPFNLLSVSKITRAYNCGVSFFPGYCVFQDLLTKKIFGRSYESGGLYVLDEQASQPIATVATITPHQLHCRLGHPSLKSLQKLCPSLRSLSRLDCESCQFAKHHRQIYVPRVNKWVSSPFELVHLDLWGPFPVSSKSDFRYFVTFVDDYSRVLGFI